MKIIGLSGSIVGSKTRTVMNYLSKVISNKYSDVDFELIDLADYDIQFSDGRNYMEYEGDTGFVTKRIMQADAIIIGTPTFQASIPATLKNIFDLLPADAFNKKIVGMFVTAGTSKHYLMVEQQLKPILTYMKARIVQSYVFVEATDLHRFEIINNDVRFRLNDLVEDMLILSKTIRKPYEEDYIFS